MSIDKFLVEYVEPQSTHRVAMTIFWWTFSIMVVKSAEPSGEGGGIARPAPFHFIHHHEQSCGVRFVRSSSEGRQIVLELQHWGGQEIM